MRNKIILVLLAALLSSCGLPGKATPTPLATFTSTPAPTATATKPSQPLTILVLPADMPTDDYNRYQTMFYNLAQAAGMRFQVLNSLSTADLALEGEALKVVVAFPPDPGLAVLAAAAPSVQFLSINIPGLTAGGNLTTLGASGAPVDQQAFLGGYIAGMVATEWKVGVLYQKDTPEGEATRNAFANGFTFYCGTCRSPNFSQPAGIYPIPVGIPATEQASNYPAYADILYQNAVHAAYVAPELATPEVISRLAQRDVLVISQSKPANADSAHWVASIQPDLDAAIQEVYSKLAAGQGGQAISTPLFLTDVNSDILTEGKLRLVQDVLDGLQNGTIDTGVAP